MAQGLKLCGKKYSHEPLNLLFISFICCLFQLLHLNFIASVLFKWPFKYTFMK